VRKTCLDISDIAETWFTEFKPLVTLMDKYIEIDARPLTSGLGSEFAAITELKHEVHAYY